MRKMAREGGGESRTADWLRSSREFGPLPSGPTLAGGKLTGAPGRAVICTAGWDPVLVKIMPGVKAGSEMALLTLPSRLAIRADEILLPFFPAGVG